MNHSAASAWLDRWGRETWYDRNSRAAEALNAKALNAKVVSLGFIQSRKESDLGLFFLLGLSPEGTFCKHVCGSLIQQSPEGEEAAPVVPVLPLSLLA